jgi:phosphoenolpyruvate carboxykinase (ATP)
MSGPTILFSPKNLFHALGLSSLGNIHYQLSPDDLINQTVERGEGLLSDTGALVINTGKFKGRSPLDKFIIKDEVTDEAVDWNNINQPMDPKYFDQLLRKTTDYLNEKELWIRDCYACADPDYRMNIRILNEDPASNLYAYNMFLRPREEELKDFVPHWHIVHAPGFEADPKTDGTRQGNFTILDFSRKTVLIGGTKYTGEIKKGIFSILNFILPHQKNVLSMHCSANIGKNGDTALFFGLSGTGKTTLSADPSRMLIGDDEHGWTDHSVFNFEGGCYAKTINLHPEKEPDIYNAIRHGALVENVTFIEGTNQIDYNSREITENTRASYPITFIEHAIQPSIGSSPKNIFLLTCDAYGILPPVSKLNTAQAMYQFITGYTAKVAGTEEGVDEPKPVFSACFGAPFLPLHPMEYATMLGKKIKENGVNVWMVNTGWSGGSYGTGSRIELQYTRAIINAVLEGKLSDVAYEPHPVFGMMMPKECPGVPSEILKPVNTWKDKEEYMEKARKLASAFVRNFEKFAARATAEVLSAAPKPH